MKICYDHEVDASYIRLLDGKDECRSIRLSDEVALNMGAGEKLVGIEIGVPIHQATTTRTRVTGFYRRVAAKPVLQVHAPLFGVTDLVVALWPNLASPVSNLNQSVE